MVISLFDSIFARFELEELTPLLLLLLLFPPLFVLGVAVAAVGVGFVFSDVSTVVLGVVGVLKKSRVRLTIGVLFSFY
jgi:hypothetical protein